MITTRELATALYGAWRLARLDPQGQNHFDASITGFWRSFQAAALLAPAYALLITFDIGQREITVDPLRLLLIQCLAYTINWTAFPLVMVSMAQRLDRKENYLRFIVAHNWANVLQMAVFLPVAAVAAYSVGVASEILPLVATVMIFFYQWFVARTVLGINPFQAVGIVVVDLVLGVALTLIVNGMVIGPVNGAN